MASKDNQEKDSPKPEQTSEASKVPDKSVTPEPTQNVEHKCMTLGSWNVAKMNQRAEENAEQHRRLRRHIHDSERLDG
jgi:hypothetical protein